MLFFYNCSVIYTQLVVAAQKNESGMLEATEVRSKAAEVETEEVTTVLATLTEHVA